MGFTRDGTGRGLGDNCSIGAVRMIISSGVCVFVCLRVCVRVCVHQCTRPKLGKERAEMERDHTEQRPQR
jgi:hypothetical protein